MASEQFPPDIIGGPFSAIDIEIVRKKREESGGGDGDGPSAGIASTNQLLSTVTPSLPLHPPATTLARKTAPKKKKSKQSSRSIISYAVTNTWEDFDQCVDERKALVDRVTELMNVKTGKLNQLSFVRYQQEEQIYLIKKYREIERYHEKRKNYYTDLIDALYNEFLQDLPSAQRRRSPPLPSQSAAIEETTPDDGVVEEINGGDDDIY